VAEASAKIQKPKQMKTKLTIGLLALLCCIVGAKAQNGSINGNAKATFQTSYTAVLGPFSSSTSGNGPIITPWTTVLEQSLKSANNWDLVVGFCSEVGLLTSTGVSSKNMVTDVSTASASVKVRVLVDGQEIAPGEVTYGKRTSTLSATLEGAIAGCLSIVTNASGQLTIVLDQACVTPETIGLTDDSMAAASFTFCAPNEATGVHLIQVQAQIATMGNNQNGTFGAVALLGKSTLTVESSRTVKAGSQLVLGQ
jgi:hypothetical protein